MRILPVTALCALVACTPSKAPEDTGSDPDEPGDELRDTAEEEEEEREEEEEPEQEAPNWSGVWMVNLDLHYLCRQDFVDQPRADEDGEQQTVMLQLSGPTNNLYAATPNTDSSWSMAGSGDESGITLGGSLRMEVDGEVIDWDSNVTIHAREVVSAREVHGTIFGSFSANSGWWECEFKDTPSTVVLKQ